MGYWQCLHYYVTVIISSLCVGLYSCTLSDSHPWELRISAQIQSQFPISPSWKSTALIIFPTTAELLWWGCCSAPLLWTKCISDFGTEWELLPVQALVKAKLFDLGGAFTLLCRPMLSYSSVKGRKDHKNKFSAPPLMSQRSSVVSLPGDVLNNPWQCFSYKSTKWKVSLCYLYGWGKLRHTTEWDWPKGKVKEVGRFRKGWGLERTNVQWGEGTWQGVLLEVKLGTESSFCLLFPCSPTSQATCLQNGAHVHSAWGDVDK